MNKQLLTAIAVGAVATFAGQWLYAAWLARKTVV